MSMKDKLKKWIKTKLAVQMAELAIDADERNSSLVDDIKAKMDANKDGKINIHDLYTLALKYLDADGSGSVDIWEYILFTFQCRAAIKKVKGE